jgi:hypothetical protein
MNVLMSWLKQVGRLICLNYALAHRNMVPFG